MSGANAVDDGRMHGRGEWRNRADLGRDAAQTQSEPEPAGVSMGMGVGG